MLWRAFIALALLGALPGAGLLALFLSLPTLDADITASPIASPVSIRRDALGTVSIDSTLRSDAAWALGYVHAQDRLFQMDMMRRTAAGELSELVGKKALGADFAARRWQFRRLAREQLANAREDLLSTLQSYTAGVNAGMRSLKVRPFEYIVLRTGPEPWREEDCLLLIHAMFLMLTDPSASREQFLGELKRSVTPEVFRFLTWSQGDWDSSFIASPLERMPGIPAPQRAVSGQLRQPGDATVPELQKVFPGSSAWAVSGRKTGHAPGLLGVDMHLSLTVPNIWYRAQVHIHGANSRPHSVYGLTFPGFPGFIVGSNERIAWGLSNTQGDWSDLLILAPCTAGTLPGYRVDSECEPFQATEQHIKVAHGADVRVRLLHTRWGPLIDSNNVQEPAVHRWLGDAIGATNLGYLDLVDANDVTEALEIARDSGMPPVNFVVADSAGRIGWTIAGQLPRRTDTCPVDPQPASSRSVDEWQQFEDPGTRLRIVDPPQGYIVTANQRILPDVSAPIVCDGAYQLGARAQQIERALATATAIDEMTAMQIQLDDRAVFFERWRDLLLEVIGDRTEGRYQILRARLQAWDGRASPDSVAYRFIREFRETISSELLAMLAQSSLFGGYELYGGLPQAEYPVWKMISEQPHDWLPEGYENWPDYIRGMLDRLLNDYEMRDPQLTHLTWGKRNTLDMRNPVLGNLPLVGRYFGFSGVELPGDTHMPRVQAPVFGASQRLVVAPGREQYGILTMPGGQSGNPLSPFFSAGHEHWIEGAPLPLLAGPARHTIIVSPAR